MNKANDSVGAHAVAGISILVSPDITGPANSPIGSSAGIQTGSSQPSTSKDPAKQSQGTSSQKNSLSTSLSGHAESDSNKVSPENGSRQGKEMHSLTNSSSTSSAGTDTASTPTASRDDLPSDDDSSTGFLQSNARKRRLESQEDDGKPAAQRSRLGDVTAAPQCDGPVDSNEDTRPNPIDVKEENDSSLQSPVVNLSRCGYCETCTESYVCGKCSRCSFKIPCVFSPCYNYGIHDSTLHHYKQQANSVKVADAQFEGQFEKIYGENGVISKTNLQRERMSPAVKSTTTKGRHGQWPGSLCGTCSSCTDPVICGKCSSCLGRRDGRCAFAPCLAYDYKASTLSTFIKNAKSVTKGDKPLEDKFEELYGDDGVFATKLKDVDRSESDEPPSKWQRAGGHCGNCSSCTSPMACGKCIACLGHRKGRCVFALCLAYNYAETTLAKSREQAKSAKVGNMRLEQQFEHLYGPGGVFASKVNSKNEPKVLHDKKVRSRCGTCLSCTAMLRCKKCQACLGKRNGACVFHPCLTYEYKESTLNLYRQQAQSVKGGDKCLEDQFERIYGEQGLIAQKDNLINTFSPSKVPAVAKASSSLRSYIHNCQNCSSCCSPITCGICVRCRKGTKCVFSICQNFAYKDTRMVMYEKWARQACEMCTDKKLKVRFDEIFSKGTTKAEAKRQAATYQRAQSVKAGEKRLEDQFERIYGTEGLITAQKDKSINTSSRLKVHEEAKASPRPRSFRCHNCSSCCSPITCLICTRCHKGTKCIFSICQNYAYKDSRMTIYETWARKALEICKDKKLKVRYEEIFGKSTTKVNTKRKADTDQPPIGTRIYGEWPGNNRWYFGKITSQRPNLFDIKFDDGDERKGATRDQFVTIDELKGMVTDLTMSDDEGNDAATNDGNVAHFLLNKGYYHQWINRDGNVKAAYGKFESCALTDGEIAFTVTLDLSVGHWLAFGVRNEAPNLRLSRIEEADAWAGYISFLAETEGKKFSDPSDYLPENKPFYRHYIVPTIHACSQQKTMNLVVKGHRVQLKAKESKIPNGGLGLFITATPISSLGSCCKSRDMALVLEEGELIDLGVYAPLRPGDLKPDHVLIVKNFVHNWKSEGWSFDACVDDRLVFDITDDDTGDLGKVAESNVVIYTNETNGNERATVFAKEDPEGAVHYYLGYSDPEQGRLLIPTDGTEMELKVDYGSKYESVRVRKCYSRLVGLQLEEEEKKASTYEKDMLNELSTFTTEEVFDAQNFLEKLNSKWTEAVIFNDMGAVGRAMLVSLVLLRRAIGIKNEMHGDRMHMELVRSLHELSLHFFDRFDYATNRSLVLENELYAELLSTTLGLVVVKSIGDNTHSIRKAIQSLV